MLEIVGILVVAALVITLFVRPAGMLGIIFAVGVVAAAIVVSWNDVQQTRQQRAANTGFQQQNSAAAVTVPAPDHARAGS